MELHFFGAVRVSIPWIHEPCWFCSIQELLQHFWMVFKNLSIYQLSYIFLRNPSSLKFKFHLCDWLGRRFPFNLGQIFKVWILKSLEPHKTICTFRTCIVQGKILCPSQLRVQFHFETSQIKGSVSELGGNSCNIQKPTCYYNGARR